MVPSISCLVTGATGFAGSHLAEACLERGWDVRTLARPTSDTSFLDPLPITIVRGDLNDPNAVRAALDGVTVVLHAAAKVGDWGPVEDYRAVNVAGLRTLLEACREVPLTRFVQLSSLGVYAARHHYATDESEPLPEQHIDGYTQSKVEAEALARIYQREHGVPVTVIRPGFIYGPRDRAVLPQIVDKLRRKQVRYLGGGHRAMNTVYIGNLVEAVLLAAEAPEAVGEVFNVTDGERVTKQQFLTTIADGLGLPRPSPVPVPLWLAKVLAWSLEGAARRRGATQPPRLTQARLKFLGYNLDFSIEKAKRVLGYRPLWSFEQGMHATLASFGNRVPMVVPAIRKMAG